MSEQTETQATKTGGGLGFIREVVNEAKRVVWPSKEETQGAAFTVIVMVAVLGVFLGVVDFLASNALGWMESIGIY